jgi:hypothetical protein
LFVTALLITGLFVSDKQYQPIKGCRVTGALSYSTARLSEYEPGEILNLLPILYGNSAIVPLFDLVRYPVL